MAHRFLVAFFLFSTALGAQDSLRVYEIYDLSTLPLFPGGEPALQRFLRDNISFPAISRDSNICTTFAFQFVIQRDGRVTEVKTLRHCNSNYEQQVIDILQNMPRWQPGRIGDTEVATRFTLPIRIHLE